MKVLYGKRAFTGREVIENAAILIDGQKIIAAGQKDSLSVPTDAES